MAPCSQTDLFSLVLYSQTVSLKTYIPRDQCSLPYKTENTITDLCISSNFYFLTGEGNINSLEIGDNKQSLKIICPSFLPGCKFDLLPSFIDMSNSPFLKGFSCHRGQNILLQIYSILSIHWSSPPTHIHSCVKHLDPVLHSRKANLHSRVQLTHYRHKLKDRNEDIPSQVSAGNV